MIQIIVGVILLILTIVSITLSIISILKAKTTQNNLDKWIQEVKTRMSSLIKDINTVNELEYNYDIQQQENINSLLKPPNV
jgi:hypothetical protein